MSVLSESFLAFVRGHLVPFFLLSARHNGKYYKGLLFLDFCEEALGRLEGRNVVSRDDDGGVLGDVAGGLFFSSLDDEAAETSQINVFTFYQRFLDHFHEAFDGGKDLILLSARSFGDLIDDVSFSHVFIY